MPTLMPILFLSVLWALFMLRVSTHVLRRLYNSLVVRALTTDCTLYSYRNPATKLDTEWMKEKQNFDLYVQGLLRKRWTKISASCIHQIYFFLINFLYVRETFNPSFIQNSQITLYFFTRNFLLKNVHVKFQTNHLCFPCSLK